MWSTSRPLLPTLPEALKVAGVARRTLPEASIVLGGVHPTLTDPWSVLNDPNVTISRFGAGEIALGRLLDNVLSGNGGDLQRCPGFAIGAKPGCA